MPSIDGGHDLLEHLDSIGFCMQGDNGVSGVSYQEIKAWRDSIGIELTSWENETLFILSRAYAEMMNKATDPNCKQPFQLEDKYSQAQRIQDQIFG